MDVELLYVQKLSAVPELARNYVNSHHVPETKEKSSQYNSKCSLTPTDCGLYASKDGSHTKLSDVCYPPPLFFVEIQCTAIGLLENYTIRMCFVTIWYKHRLLPSGTLEQ
jgi:hypothetical protein